MDNTAQMKNLTGNLVALAKQMFTLAMEQYHWEFDAGSRSNSRSQLLGEIGSYSIDLANKCKKLADNLMLLGEIPMNPNDKDDEQKRLYWQIWLLPADDKTWQTQIEIDLGDKLCQKNP